MHHVLRTIGLLFVAVALNCATVW